MYVMMNVIVLPMIAWQCCEDFYHTASQPVMLHGKNLLQCRW